MLAPEIVELRYVTAETFISDDTSLYTVHDVKDVNFSAALMDIGIQIGSQLVAFMLTFGLENLADVLGAMMTTTSLK